MIQLIYNFVGGLVFSRRQIWEQRKNGKILVLTVAFALAVGLMLAGVLRFMDQHRN